MGYFIKFCIIIFFKYTKFKVAGTYVRFNQEYYKMINIILTSLFSIILLGIVIYGYHKFMVNYGLKLKVQSLPNVSKLNTKS